jgi:hypothetical protein
MPAARTAEKFGASFWAFGIVVRKFGAGDRGRTGDVQLGKLAFYR